MAGQYNSRLANVGLLISTALKSGSGVAGKTLFVKLKKP